jgi:hypothetical protein
MGGEYLPPLLEDEVEIARVSLASVTADQTSVRARRIPRGIAYRIVDEYGEDGPGYLCARIERAPLTLAELAAIDGAQEGEASRCRRSSQRRVCHDPNDLRDFVRVSSEFYRSSRLLRARIEPWFDENYRRAQAASLRLIADSRSCCFR